jgi:thiol:disulfide interchange protein
MKKLILLLAFVSLSSNAQDINEKRVEWFTLSQALEAQKTNPKPIFIDFYTSWCGPCKMLDQQTFNVSSVAAHLNRYFYPVKFNAEGNEVVTFLGKTFKNPNYDPNKEQTRNAKHDLTTELNVKGYPSMLIIDAKGAVKQTFVGFRTGDELTNELINYLKTK